MKATGLLRLLETRSGDRTTAEAIAITMQADGIPGNARYYVQALRALRLRRELIRIGADMIRQAHDETMPVVNTIGNTLKMIEKLCEATP